MQNIFIDILPPWVETGLQPAFYDLESGTVLQQTARMYAKVRELNEAFNQFSEDVSTEINNFEHETNTEIERFEQATNDEIERFEQSTNDEIERFEGVVNDTVEEYIGKFNDLHDYVEDYFENLDVQEEINHKLDEMVEDGVLQEIITTYIQSNVAWTFDNVSEMQSATNLIVDSYARTLGFYSIGDGGGATYKIRELEESETANGMDVITISGTLVAELVKSNTFIPEQYGAKNDGSADAADIFAYIFTLMDDNTILNMTGTYLISETLYLPNKNNIVIKGGTLKADSGFTGYVLHTNLTASTGISGYSYCAENVTIKDVFIDGGYDADGIYLESYLRVKVENCTIHNIKNCGVYCKDGHEANIVNTNIVGRTYGYDDSTIISTGIILDSFDNIVDNCVIAYCQWAVEVKKKFNQIVNCHFYCNRNSGGNVKINQTSYTNLSNNYFDGSGVYAIDPWKLNISNSMFEVSDSTNHIIQLELSTASTATKGIYIENSNVEDVRTTQTDIEFVTANRNAFSSDNCYIGDIDLPAHILLSNTNRIFKLKNSVPPVIEPTGLFAATCNSHVIGSHLTLEGRYTYELNGNYIETTWVGSSGYPFIFCKINLPARASIRMINTGTVADVEIFDSNETYIATNYATLEAGEYILGIYRNAKITVTNL